MQEQFGWGETKKYLNKRMGHANFLRIEGYCHDCNREGKKKKVIVEVARVGDDIKGSNPFWWKGDLGGFVKCKKCYEKEPKLTYYQPCEIFSRVVGYLRPVQAWNVGKKQEFKMRKNFNVVKTEGEPNERED